MVFFINPPKPEPVVIGEHMDIVKFLTDPHNKALAYLQIVLLVYVIALTIPDLIVNTAEPPNGLDPSWVIGLHKVEAQGLIHGKDVLFTYGPLAFLNYPIFISRDLWLYSAGHTLLVYTLILVSFSLYLRKTRPNFVNTAIMAFVSIAALNSSDPSGNWAMSLPVFIFSFMYALGRRRPLLLIPLGVLYSVLPFIKFSYALSMFLMASSFLIILVWDKRFKEGLLFLISTLASFAILGMLLLRSGEVIIMYLYGCIQIADGYIDAMAVNGNYSQLLLPALAWFLYLTLLSYNIVKKKRSDLIFLILGFGLLFTSFKRGFVRHDPIHTHSFYSMWMLVSVLYYLKFSDKTRFARYGVLLLTLVLCGQYINLSAVTKWHYKGVDVLGSHRYGRIPAFSKGYYAGIHLPDKLKNLRLSYNLLRGIGVEEQKQKVKKDIGRYYNLKTETIEMLTGHTVDVFPWDIAITELYDFKWHPRPVFQSYSAYTAYLDSLNAKHFSSDTAPEYLLYASKSIDGRYSFFDEPETFRTLLYRYQPCGQDKGFIVLRKKDNPAVVKEEYIDKAVVGFGQIIALPKVNDGLLFARIHIEYNFAGRLLKFLFKPPQVYFGFFRNTQKIGIYRFIFGNAQNGVFLSQHIDGFDTLHKIWRGDIKDNSNQICIWAKSPAFFKDKITIEFFKVSSRMQGNSNEQSFGRNEKN